MSRLRILSTFALVCVSAVTLSAAPQLRLSTNTVGPIYVEDGANALPQTINAYNLGDGTLNLAVTSSSAPWLSGSVGQPTTCSGGPVSACIPINITFNTAGLGIGNYSGSLTLNDPNAIDSPQIVTVQLQVNGAPTSAVFFVTPNNGAATAQPDTATLVVNTGSSVLSSVSTSDHGSWLNFTLAANHIVYNSYQLRVAAQPGQAVGTYTGTVVLSGSQNPADNKTINVSLTITTQPILPIPTSPLVFNLQGQTSSSNSISFGNLGLGSLNITGASTSGASWLTASVVSRSAVSIVANSIGLAPGSYSGVVTLVSNAADATVPLTVQLNVTAATGPTIAFGGVVDNAAFVSGQAIAAGSIAAIFGTQLSISPPVNASAFPLPTTLGGVQVLINGSPVPLFYAEAGQIDIQVPFGLASGQVLVQVLQNGQPGNRVSAIVDSIAPRLFAVGQNAPDGGEYGAAILNSDSTLALPAGLAPGSHPAHLGDVLTIYALGLGPVSPSVNTGAPAPSVEPLARTTNAVQVVYGSGTGGSVTASPLYSGLAPFFAGLYQINVLLPQNAPTGNVPVTLGLPGHVSNVVEMAIAPQ